MKSPFTLGNVDRLQRKVDRAARLHRLGLILFVLACVIVTLPRADLPAWASMAGLGATLLGFAIKAAGTTVLLVEQDVNQALSVADRVYCLLEGRISLSGEPGALTKEQITDAYFGLHGLDGIRSGRRP